MLAAVDDYSRAWWIARRSDEPVLTPLGWRTDRPDGRQSWFVRSPSVEALRGIVAAAGPMDWIRWPGSAGDWASLLPGVPVAASSWMFRTDLSVPTGWRIPLGLERRLVDEGDLLRLELVADGRVVAMGNVALREHDGDRFALPDYVGVEEDCRGRGYGAAVMHELAAAALERGYPRATLSSTDMGKGLYERLGWRLIGPTAARALPET